jgi:hypothetical protein
MALSEADIEAFIEALQRDPQLRDRVRRAIIADDFLALPGIVRELGERVDALTIELRELAAAFRALVARLDEQADRLEHMDGRLGNLEGWRFESHVRLNLASYLARHYRSIRPLIIGNLAPALEALDAAKISSQEWSDLTDLDILASARRRDHPEEPELLVAVELSIVVDTNDVSRVLRRTETLRRIGLEADACVIGEAILPPANQLARERQVTLLAYPEVESD